MQAQEVPPYAEDTTVSPTSPMDAEGESGHKKKSMMGKVKDKTSLGNLKSKAKKLKTKMKSPKSPSGAGDSESSSSDDSNDEEPSQEKDVAVAPGLRGEAYEAVPDPHTDATSGVGEKLGQMKLGDEPDSSQLQEGVPSAPGQASAGGFGQTPEPVDEGKTREGKDLVVNRDASDKDSAKDGLVGGATAAAATGAAALGLHKAEDSDRNPSEMSTENKASFTSRAADTVTGLKDSIASKLGYGSSNIVTPQRGDPADSTTTSLQDDPKAAENKSYLQTLQESAAGATAAVSGKLGYGDQKSPVAGGESKPYTQQVKEAAFSAKDAVAAQLGYGGAAAEGDSASGPTYLQKARDAAIGAKDTVAANIGYGATGAQDEPTGAAARFHPGEEDKLLSALITERMSTGATTVKDTLMKPFAAAKSAPTTPTSDAPSEEQPGIVGKAKGAVSSLMSTPPPPSGADKPDEAVGKETEDSRAQTPVE